MKEPLITITASGRSNLPKTDWQKELDGLDVSIFLDEQKQQIHFYSDKPQQAAMIAYKLWKRCNKATIHYADCIKSILG